MNRRFMLRHSAILRLSAFGNTSGGSCCPHTALLLLAFSLLCAPSEAAVYNLHLATDNVPDYATLESFVESSTAAWQTPQDKAIAVWRWGRRSRRQTSCAVEDGRHILDPILHYNSYGAMNCGIISLLNIAAWRELGFQARYIQLGDHTVSEVSWDGGQTWHLFDSSMSVYCFNHAGEVASCEEIQQSHACELSGGKSEPGHYYLYHSAPACASHLGPTGWRSASDQPVAYRRTLRNGAASYIDGFSVDRYCQMSRTGHRATLNLRPYESYTRYWKPLDPARPPGDASPKSPAFFRPMADGSDPDDQHGLNNLRGNGRWLFSPDLSAADCRSVFYDDHGIALKADDGVGPAVHPREPGSTASVVFKVYAANVITSMEIEAAAVCSPDDSLEILVSRDAGLNWTSVWQATPGAPQPIRLKLQEEVAGVTQCLIKVAMRAAADVRGVGLDSFRATTLTQLNRLTLPKLTLGANQIALWAGQQVDTAELWPTLHAGAYKRTIFAEEGLSSDDQPDGAYKATLGAGGDGRECSATWRLEVPGAVESVSYAVVSTNRSPRSWVSLRHSWDGADYREFHLNRDGDFPFDEQVHQTFSGPDVPPDARRAFFRGVFFCSRGAATYNMPGIQDLLLRVAHKPRDPAFQPIEVTYRWTEHRTEGDVPRAHTELVSSLPHRYSSNVAGRRDPTMDSVTVNLQGHGPNQSPARYGYADGADVGPGWERPKLACRWGKSLAAGKPYTVSREASSASGNPDTAGCELTNAAIIAPTDYLRDEVQQATAFWDGDAPLSVVVDLLDEQTTAGVRVSTHQPNARYCHPATVEVSLSGDGRRWTPCGTIRHDDLWQPPGDPDAWEHDAEPWYDDLPAGGRLAYSYPLVFEKPLPGRYVKFDFTPQPGRGLGLSELEAFDQVEVRPWPAEIILPPHNPD